MGSGSSLASEAPEPGVDHSCPLVTKRLWSDGALPCPTEHAHGLLVSPSPYLPLSPPVSVSLPLGFYQFAMTFHLGGLTIKTSFLEMGQQVALRLGRTCPEGTMCNTEPSSPTLPVSTISSGPGSAPWALEEMHRHEGSEHLPPHHRDGSRLSRSGLARRQGVRETARAQVVFAKRLINRPGIVPTSHTVFSRLPSPAVLSRTSPVITASPLCPWTLLCRPGRCPSLGTTRHSLSQRLCPPHPGY